MKNYGMKRLANCNGIISGFERLLSIQFKDSGSYIRFSIYEADEEFFDDLSPG